MRLGALTRRELSRRLRSGLRYRIGPFSFRLIAPETLDNALLQQLYAHYALVEQEEIVDFPLALRRPASLRAWFRPQVQFSFDSEHPFTSFALADSMLPLEWGSNYAVANRGHRYLMLHAAVLAREDQAVLLSALPGGGKSTLAAAMCHRGWRLLADEFGLVRPEELLVDPFPRCIPLKNESVPVIREFAPEACLGPMFYGTRKGDLVHLRPPLESVERDQIPAQPRLILFPQYQRHAPLSFTPVPQGEAFRRLSYSAFNYQLIGERGFATVAQLISNCPAFELRYSVLDEALAVIAEQLEQALAERDMSGSPSRGDRPHT